VVGFERARREGNVDITSSTGIPAPPRRVVTISASYGAGGSVVAPQVAERLGLAFADRLITAQIAGVGVSEGLSEEERTEARRRGFLSRLAHLTGGLGLPVPDSGELRGPVRQQVEASIRQLAQDGAVILGRGAALVIAGDPAAFHVRMDGPADARCRQAMTIQGIDEATARSRLRETDRARNRYLEQLYDRDPADPTLYHLMIDSTAVPLASCVSLIVTAATDFWAGR
jgi:cytidylate kinase